MRNHISRLLLIPFLFFSLALASGSALAATSSDCPQGYQSMSGICVPSDTGLSDRPIVEILGNLMQWLFGILGFLAIMAFILSGLQYLTAAGDETQVDTAKTNMKYSVIGIIVAFSGLIVITAINQLLLASNSNF